MTGETRITVIGNLTGDPELRFIQSGAAVVNFTIASTPRTFNRQTNEFEDGDTLFMRCSLWRDQAEHVAESLTKGVRVIAVGNLVQRTFETNGEKRNVTELQVDEVGPSLRYATAKPQRVDRTANAQTQQQRPSGPPPSSLPPSSNEPDLWSAQPPTDEPPF